MPATDTHELRHTIGQLRQCIGALRAQYGDTSAVRRLANDLDRLDIDTVDFEQSPTPQLQNARRGDVIYVPDSKSDESAWMGAQDEGLGFHSRERTR